MHYAYPATIFLAELLPSRSPLRFKPQKIMTFAEMTKKKEYFQPAK